MKVNTSLLLTEEEKSLQAEDKETDAVQEKEPETDEDVLDEDEDEDGDESRKHSKLKTVLLLAAMIGGFGLFVWNMTGLVNNMRLDNQGHAVNVVYEMEELDSFMGDADSDEHAGSLADAESEVSTDAVRDGPAASGVASAADSTDDVDELRQMAKDALNEAALVRQELKNAEDMLDSSLAREADLLNRLDERKGN